MGMWMPRSVATSVSSVPLGTRIDLPSMVTPTRPSSGAAGGVGSAAIYAVTSWALVVRTGHDPAPQCALNSSENAL